MTTALQLTSAVEVGPTGLTLPPRLSFNQWQAIGKDLMLAHLRGEHYLSSVRWAIADWIIYGENQYGETYAQAIEDTGLSYQRLANLVWVGRRFEPSRRRENLYIEHHAVVARLIPACQDSWLDAAEMQGWSAGHLREELMRAEEGALGLSPGEALAARLLERAVRGVGGLDPDQWAYYVVDSLVEPLGRLDIDRPRYHSFLVALRDRIDELLKGAK